MSRKVAVNGFGRIGRNVFRACLNNPAIDIVAVNDVAHCDALAHLLKYDSVHGILNAQVEAKDNELLVNGKKVKVLAERNPSDLPWADLGVEVVVESTGLFVDRANAGRHLEAGAKKVIITAPAKEPDITLVLGVNEKTYDKDKHHIISNASCTTNCLAPVAKVLMDSFGFARGIMTTIHAYTNDQRILDLCHKDLRRARAAALSMIPTTTGAAKAVSLVLPALKGKLDGFAIRVPTPNVSLVDLVADLEKETTADKVNDAFKKAARTNLQGYLAYSDKPLVSCDFNGNPHSSIVDGAFTTVVEGKTVKVLAWYDNETGYSNRVKDLILYI